MKKYLLLLFIICGASLSGFAQRVVKNPQKVNIHELRKAVPDNNVTILAVPECVEGVIPNAASPKPTVRTAKKQLQRADGVVVDTVQYFAIAQSFHKNYVFNYEGGEIFNYNVGLAIDGTKATFTNLFNMYEASLSSWSRCYDYPVEGVYDAEAGTITIPTTVNGIVCGDYGGYYDAMLLAGEISEGGTLTPAEELVFNVTTGEDGQIATITAASHFLAKHTYGTIVVYKSFTANIPQEGVADVFSFSESIDFGEAFVNTAVEKTITLYNRGGMDAEFAMELEAEDDAFTSTAMTGVVPAHGSLDVPFTFLASKAGSYEGIATIVYDNGTDEATLVVDLAGAVKDYPDYSAAFKNTDKFEVTTNIEFPFEMSSLTDGTPVAKSGTHGKYGQSWLCLNFTVPAGKLATVSWKGVCNNSSFWYMNSGGYFIDTLDGAKASFTGQNEDMSGSWEFAPGEHFIRFQYDGNYYSGLEENYLYVYDIDYSELSLEADSAIVLTPEVNLGNDVLVPGNSSVKTGVITLKNTGANSLVVKNVTSDNADFTADISGLTETATMAEVNIPVTMETKTAGEKKATYTIETTAGTFYVTVSASVMEMPDFASLVTEGAEYITSWTVNPDAPFIIKDGKAVNKNAGSNDVMETAWFQMNLNIPEGKLAYVSWEGRCMGRPEVEGDYSHYYSSYAYFEMSHPMTSGTMNTYGSGKDAGSASFENDESWGDYLACIPGNHYYKWAWYHNGDGTTPEGDCLEISNIKIHVIDFAENGVKLETPEVAFDTIYVGPQRYTTAKVTLRNTGSADLTIGQIKGDIPFYGIETETKTQFNKTIQVELWFYPSDPGEYEGEVVINTSAGDVVVNCKGVALDAAEEGYVYLGDFEDDAYGWTIHDNDGDGETWNLGSNLWGENASYCHSGTQCLGSVSFSNYLGAITPDNWTFSPVITIPAEGADLSYYVSAFHPSRFEEHYSLYVHEFESETFSVDDVLKNEPVISETLQEENGALDGWSKRECSLDNYAGKKIILCFRHHDCNGQYILRLDDVNVTKKNTSTAINAVAGQNQREQAVYSLDGRQVKSAEKGLYILRSVNEKGGVEVRKVLK